jgi:uncharacterized protein
MRCWLHIPMIVRESIICLLMVLFGTCGIVLAEADGPDFYAVTGVSADDVLNIRAGPDARSRKIGSIPHNGRGLRNLGCEGGPGFAEWQRMTAAERQAAARRRWCRIEYQGVEGWVAGWYLTEDSAPPAENAVRPAMLPPGAGPSFDCSRVASDSGAAMVCRDVRLAALDRELARIYQRAAGDVGGARHDELVAMQRGWIKGRDDCWKAGDQLDCITFSYLDRIAELRRDYAAARADEPGAISRGPIPFACGDGIPVLLTFVATDLPLAHLARMQDKLILELQASGSGSRYAGDDAQFWIKGDQALFRLPAGNETNCSVDPSG